jgi:transposase
VAVAVGHTILIIVYYRFTHGTLYEDLGATYFDQCDHSRVKHRLVRRLEALGYTVRSEPPAV